MMALTQEDKNEIEIIVNGRIAEIIDGLLDEFGRFVNDVPARQLLEAVKHRSEKEAARLKAQTAETGLPLASNNYKVTSSQKTKRRVSSISLF